MAASDPVNVLCHNIWPICEHTFSTFFFPSFCILLCHKHTHTHSLGFVAMNLLQRTLSPHFLDVEYLPKLLLNRFPLLC